MKTIKEYITNESWHYNPDKEWCCWDYKLDDGRREILVWKGDGHDDSSVEEWDKNGTEIMNSSFNAVMEYVSKHKDSADKVCLDISNAKIENLYKCF